MGLFFPNCGTSYCNTGSQKLSFAGVTAGHIALFGLLALVVPAEHLTDLVRPFTARLIESTPEIPPPPPKQKPQKVPPLTPLPLLVAAPTPTPTPQVIPFTVAPQAPAPPAPPPLAAMPVAEAPVIVVAARFDADYLDNPKPLYPQASRRLNEEGRVLLRVRVSAAGTAESVEVKHSSGFQRLDQAAIDAITRWRFVPARRGSEMIAAWVLVPITFNLQG
ncbi:MAG: energy transducer TonB [Rhodocyclaceae bacterium]|nr:energy transducer TonB [Rhodocyclaceae bacterium]